MGVLSHSPSGVRYPYCKKKIFDSLLERIASQFGVRGESLSDLSTYGELVSYEEGHYTLRVPKAETARITGRLLADLPVVDLLVEDPPIEEVIEQVFAQEGS